MNELTATLSELYEHPTTFMFPSVIGVRVSNYWF